VCRGIFFNSKRSVTEPSILTPQRYGKDPHFLSGSPIPHRFLKEVIAWTNYHLKHKVIDLSLHSEAVLINKSFITECCPLFKGVIYN